MCCGSNSGPQDWSTSASLGDQSVFTGHCVEKFYHVKAKFLIIIALLYQIMSLCPLHVCFLIFSTLILIGIVIFGCSHITIIKIKLALTLSESAIEYKWQFPTRQRNCYLRGQKEIGNKHEDNCKYLC